jgi:hypothetical protein
MFKVYYIKAFSIKVNFNKGLYFFKVNTNKYNKYIIVRLIYSKFIYITTLITVL